MILWRQLQRESFTALDKVALFLELDPENKARLLSHKKFPLLLPRRLAAKIKKNDLKGPIAKQFLPVLEETFLQEGFVSDPVEDGSFRKTGKLLQKYQGRALILSTSVCAMHCRFCFRQNFSYEKEKSGFEEELAYLKEDTSIHEVILSGGDPLSLSDEALKALFASLNELEHIRLVRFHSRFPIGIPERITEEFLEALTSCKKQIFFMLHVNHSEELDDDHFRAFKKIQCLGIPILTQTVLLKDVNDDKESLKTLFLLLVSHGLIPYYINHLDQVQGAGHFMVSKEKGLALLKELRSELPGYALPTFVEEAPHQPSKLVIR
jgi:EF-P beta-lysylation protein EpmB